MIVEPGAVVRLGQRAEMMAGASHREGTRACGDQTPLDKRGIEVTEFRGHNPSARSSHRPPHWGIAAVNSVIWQGLWRSLVIE